MRIALVAHQLPPRHLGGVEVYTWTLAQRLVALGHVVAIFCPTDDRTLAGEYDEAGLTLVRPWRADPRRQTAPMAFWHSFRHVATERAFGRFVRRWQPDVVHVQHLQWVSARLMRLCAGVPTVMTLHDYWYLCPNSQLVLPDGQACPHASTSPCGACLLAARGAPPWILATAGPLLDTVVRWRNRYVREAALRANLLLTPSGAARDIYVAAGFPEARLRVFANGVDPRRLTVSTEARPPRDHAIFGYLGGVAWQKGVHVLLAAFAALPPQHKLRVYGPLDAFPAYVAELRQLARQHPGIQLLGAVPSDQVGAVLADLDYLVVPSLWAETFGMVAQEANYLGVPVIASRIGALTRIRDGIDGHLFAPGDVQGLSGILRELAADPSARTALAAHLDPGPTIDEQAEALVAIYGNLKTPRF